MKPSRLFRLCAFLAVILSPYGAQAASLPGFTVVRYSVIDNRYILRCTLNGKPLNMLIDCGASLSVIDKSAFDRAIPKAEQVVPKGLPSKVTANGVEIPVFLAKGLVAGPMRFGDGPVAIYDMSRSNLFARHFSRHSQNEHVVLDGLIGLDILRTYNAVIDTSRQVIYFNASRSKKGGTLGDGMKSFGYTRVRMSLDRHGNLDVPSTLEGKPGRLLVDTGAHISLLDYRYARSANVSMRPSSSLTSGIAIRMGLGIGNGGATEVYVAEPNNFKVGDYQFRKGPVGCLHHSFPTDGFLGPDLLERAHAFIDFGNNSLFLK